MRIKNDVEFVKKECMSDDSIGWDDQMECRCGEIVSEVKKLKDTEVKCIFSDGDWWSYPPSCLEEEIMLEKGKKYTINGSPDFFEFVEESENFAIFKDGYAIEKEGNTFTEHDPKPEFLKMKWDVKVEDKRVLVSCGNFYLIEIDNRGCRMVTSVSERLGLPLDDRGTVKVVK